MEKNKTKKKQNQNKAEMLGSCTANKFRIATVEIFSNGECQDEKAGCMLVVGRDWDEERGGK